MHLNEILEENTIKGISQKTKISEDNLENLLGSNFEALKKIKALGFISILEREYKADLTPLREEALAYYAEHVEDHAFSVAAPMEEGRKSKSKLFLVVVLALLVYASWYFFTQFDKKHLSGLIPFMDEQMTQSVETESEDKKNNEVSVEELSIANVVNSDINAVEDVVVQEVTKSSEAPEQEENVSVEPVGQF